jgi:hypothetical protein
MVKKAENKKTSKKEIIDKSIKTVEYLIVPVAGVAAIWGFDISVGVAVVAGAIIGVLKCVEVFIKD